MECWIVCFKNSTRNTQLLLSDGFLSEGMLAPISLMDKSGIPSIRSWKTEANKALSDEYLFFDVEFFYSV